MFSHNINPILFKIDFIQVTYYALVYIIGFLVSLFVLLRAIKNKEINITKEQAYNFTILSIIGLLAGARIFHVLFWDLPYFSKNPVEIFYIWNGGLSFYGGLLGIAVVAAFYTRKYKISLAKLADILILPAAFFLVLARIANFINQEIVGTVTSVSWCFVFQGYEGCRHPVQLYAAAGKFVLFTFLLFLKRKIKLYKAGFLFWIFIFLLGIGRFFLDFLREDIRYLGLSFGQWFSLITVLIALPVLIKVYNEGYK